MIKDLVQADSPVTKALDMLKRIRRLEGSALISDGAFLHCDCPVDADTHAFLQATSDMFDTYVERGERTREVLLGFEECDVLYLFRYPVTLCLFFKHDRDLRSIEAGGNQFLRQFGPMLGIREQPAVEPAIKSEEWNDEDFDAAMRGAPVKVKPKVNGISKPLNALVVPDPDRIAARLEQALSMTEGPEVISEPVNLDSPPINKDEPTTPEVPAPAPPPVIKPVALKPELPAESLPEKTAEPEVKVTAPAPQVDKPAEPEPDLAWQEFLSEMENLITKVIGCTHAKKSINHELDEMGLTKEQGVKPSEYQSFGLRLTGKIRDRKIRRLIENELASLLETL